MTFAFAPRARHPAEPWESLIRLGMPQLALGGLSESWLLKELADRHWMMIARAAGLDRPAFRDRNGVTVYAAFCGLSLRDARLDAAQENADLLVRSDLARVSATQFASRHRLETGGEAIGTLELSSVFVTRKEAGRNRSIARVSVEGLPLMSVETDFASVTALAQTMRAGTRAQHFGFDLTSPGEHGSLDLRPCPSLDFNGAGFLYFSSFQAFADRAEWALLDQGTPRHTRHRDIVFYGNADVGETVTVEIAGLREGTAGLDHWCRIRAGERLLADVFSRRSPPHPPV